MRRLALLITTEQMDVDKGNFELFWNERKEPQPGPGKKEATKFFAQRKTIIIITFSDIRKKEWAWDPAYVRNKAYYMRCLERYYPDDFPLYPTE